MHFIDECVIYVRGGAGGNGCVAFRRETHVPRGGPAGGDGGSGGNVIFRADPGLMTLLDLRYQKEYRAERGEHGQGHDRDGRSGRSRVVPVPCGTLVYDCDSGGLLADLVDVGQEFIAAQGGRGGKGNRRFATSTNRAPRMAEPGEPGEERRLRIVLKLLADVGLVGLPNAGKSTLISKISAARPKIADYPFTTLMPSLGVVSLGEERSFVMADIPGLIAGAHEGVGLGHRFLRHIERTRVLVFLLDDRHAFSADAGGVFEDFVCLQSELKAFNASLLDRPSLVVLNKIDLLDSERLSVILDDFSSRGVTLHPISAIAGHGIPQFLEGIWQILQEKDAENKSPD